MGGKSIVSRGKSIQEAVSIALALLNATQDEVEIEVIEAGTKKLFGFGSKPAVVRVTTKERASKLPSAAGVDSTFDMLEKAVESMEFLEGNGVSMSDPEHSETGSAHAEQDLSGKAWVRNGQIFCKNAPDKYPLVTPGDGMKLYKNEKPVEKTAVISEEDTLRVELENEVQEPHWEVKMADDKLKVTLTVMPGFYLYRKLKDKKPDSHIQLEVEERKEPYPIETGVILDRLKEMGVVYGIDFTEIARACAGGEAGTYVIAKGIEPVPGKHGRFVPMKELDIKVGLKERSDGTIDYREFKEFPSVERGQIIGVIQPPVPGKPGTTVTGEPAMPPDVLPLAVYEGKGVALVDDGVKVIATEAGIPDIKIKGQSVRISVKPKLLIGKDVDLETGNVHFTGDVQIAGSVQDGMLVEADGNVSVFENVNRAKIIAGNSVIVQNNVITSDVTAGKNNMLVVELSQKLKEMIEQMKQMVAAIHQLSAVSAFKTTTFTRTGLGPLLMILCDGKFKSFRSLTASFIAKVKDGTEYLDPMWIGLAEQLKNGFSIASDFKSVEDIIRLIQKAEELYSHTQDSPENSGCFIKAGFVQNSQMVSSGDISIVGQGVYNSRLYAGGFIQVDGFVRGGEIYAAQGISIWEAGTKGGITTKISVPKGKTIRIHHAMEDTVIQIGQKMHRFLQKATNVYARLDEDGTLQIR